MERGERELKKVRCWAQLMRPSLVYNFYLYFDSVSHLADRLIPGIRIQKQEYAHPEYKYHMIVCQVTKSDSKHIITALDQLPEKMLLCGYTDYIDFCQNQLQLLKKLYPAVPK